MNALFTLTILEDLRGLLFLRFDQNRPSSCSHPCSQSLAIVQRLYLLGVGAEPSGGQPCRVSELSGITGIATLLDMDIANTSAD